MIFAFSLRRKTALVKDDTEQTVSLRVARVCRDYLSSCRFRFFEPARLKQVCSFRKFGGLTVGSRNASAGFGCS